MTKNEKLIKFIKMAQEVHQNKYDYTKTEYTSSKLKVIIECRIHGEFYQSPEVHLKTAGCQKCSYSISSKNKTYSQEKILARANEKHKNKYDYSKVKYENILKKVEIICPAHGSFFQTMNDHVNNKCGCLKCSNLLIGDRDRMIPTDYIKKCNDIHSNKYDYSRVNYINMHTKILIICPIHGSFSQQAQAHIKGSGCPICRASKGELIVESFLNNNNISFIAQYKFKDCKGNRRTLPFDFYLPDKNILIEYDGYHHYFPIYGVKRLQERQRLDKIKTEYANANNIKLIRIHFSKILKINDILNHAIISYMHSERLSICLGGHDQQYDLSCF